MTAPTIHRLRHEGLLVLRWGRGGPDPVVALHGFTGHGLSFENLGRAVAHGGGSLWAPVLPGHDPLSPPLEGEGFVDAARRLGRILEAMLDEPCRLVGYSMGARVALVLALERPELVRALLLVGVHPGLEPAARERRRAEERRWQSRLRDQGLLAFLSWWESRPLVRVPGAPRPRGARPAESASPAPPGGGVGRGPRHPRARRDAGLPRAHRNDELADAPGGRRR
ncbi:MAG: alpha/beta fold hydrolase [Acidobacteriota bacterium]|nr:alpha/beta fold hydrolase [Acidobacteriota bacterium]